MLTERRGFLAGLMSFLGAGLSRFQAAKPPATDDSTPLADTPTVIGVDDFHEISGWQAIELAIPISGRFERKPHGSTHRLPHAIEVVAFDDWVYAPVFARIEEGKLVEWTTVRPACFGVADAAEQELARPKSSDPARINRAGCQCSNTQNACTCGAAISESEAPARLEKARPPSGTVVDPGCPAA